MNDIKKYVLIIASLCVLFPLIVNAASEPEDISQYFPEYSTGGKKTINCTYEVNLNGNQGAYDQSSYYIDVTFTNKIVKANFFKNTSNSDSADSGAIEIWSGSINGSDIKYNSYLKTDDGINISFGNNYSQGNYSADMTTSSTLAIKPENAFYTLNYSDDYTSNAGKFTASANYTCPELAFQMTKDGIDIYSQTYVNQAQAGDRELVFYNMSQVSTKDDNDVEYDEKDTSGYTGEYSTCGVVMKSDDGSTYTNLKVHAYKDGGYSISLDGKNYTKVYEDNDIVWSGKTHEIKGESSTEITKKYWDSDFKTQINYEKCIDEPSITVTMTRTEGTTINGKDNGFQFSQSGVSKEDGGIEDVASGDSFSLTTSDLLVPNTQISLDKLNCEDILSSDLISFIQSAWNLVKVASVVITILFGIFDFISSESKDKDVLMASVNKTIKRIIVLLIILLLPTIIDIIGNFIGQDNILCGIK